jgi:hypothetical protein
MAATEAIMRAIIFLLLACLLAAVAPCFSPRPVPQNTAAFPGWPATFDGAAVQALPRTARERQFEQEFPGKIGRFSDGKREIIIRWVTHETRTLHPAADCFRGIGYTITPRPLTRDAHNRTWSTFTAQKGPERLYIRELITDSAGNSWSDVSSWYWSAVLQRTHGPWWAYTVAECGKTTSR